MRKELYYVGVFILAIWLVFFVDLVLPQKINEWGVYPWKLTGLIGIPLMPFLHAGFAHLLGNTVSLGILMFLLVSSRPKPWPAVALIVVLNGILLWAMGRDGNHIGASGLVFGLIAYLLVLGFVERKPVSIGVALAVGFFFGGTLISGVIPRIGSEVSWDGHLFGAIAGGIVAYAMNEKSKLMAWR